MQSPDGNQLWGPGPSLWNLITKHVHGTELPKIRAALGHILIDAYTDIHTEVRVFFLTLVFQNVEIHSTLSALNIHLQVFYYSFIYYHSFFFTSTVILHHRIQTLGSILHLQEFSF